jgi:hypothetical protein
LVITEGAASVRHKTFGILLHHEFPRDAGYRVLADFSERIEAPKKRTAYLVNKLLSLDKSTSNLLFVRETTWTESQKVEEEIKAELSRLFRKASWRLVFISGPPETPQTGWRCDPDAWNAELKKLQAVVDRRLHTPFSVGVVPNSDQNIID